MSARAYRKCTLPRRNVADKRGTSEGGENFTATCLGLRRVFVLVGVLALLAWGCVESTGGLVEAHDELQQARFGPLDLAQVEIRPGRVVDLARERERPVFALRSSAPWPELVLHNGAETPTMVGLRLRNVDPEAELEASLGRLPVGVRRAAACAGDEEGEPQRVEIAPPARTPPLPDLFSLELALPACSSLRIRLSPALERDALRFLIASPPETGVTQLRALLDEAQALEADALVLMGGATMGPAELSGIAAERGVPLIALPGRPERALGLGSWQETMGPADFHFRAGTRRIVVLNTIAGSLSGAQFSLLRALPVETRGDIAFMIRPPLAPDRSTGRGLQSDQQGIRLLSKLSALGVELIVSASAERSASSELEGIRTESLGKRNEDRRRLLILSDPWAPRCDGEDCPQGLALEPLPP